MIIIYMVETEYGDIINTPTPQANDIIICSWEQKQAS